MRQLLKYWMTKCLQSKFQSNLSKESYARKSTNVKNKESCLKNWSFAIDAG